MRHSGFSLLELAMSLVIIAVITAASIDMGSSLIEAERLNQTNAKLDAIEKALQAFRQKNYRLPCPADGTLAQTSANFGVEAANAGTCTGGAPAANFGPSGEVVQGVVPVRALGLSNEFMIDGWGSKISYTVNNWLTGSEAFLSGAQSDACGQIEVRDASGGARTSGAAYALISHGPNGHGGYVADAATRRNAGSTNADEQQNCNCDASAAATAFNAIYVQKDKTEDPTTSTNKFDDIVRFKERWQMQLPTEGAPPLTSPPYIGPEVLISHLDSPYFTAYRRTGNMFRKLPDPATLPTQFAMSMDFSYDNRYVAVPFADTPYLYVYSRSYNTLTRLAGGNGPQSNPPNMGTGSSFSKNGNYLAVSHYTSPYVTIYKRASDTFTKLANPASLPTGDAWDVTFSPNNDYVAVTHATSPFVTIYKRNGDTFTKLTNPATLPAGNAWHSEFSPTGTYLAVTHDNSPWITIYKRSCDTFTKLADPATLPPNGTNMAVWSYDERYLAVAHADSPYVTIYKRSNDTFTKIADPATLPVAAFAAVGVAFSRDSLYFAVTYDAPPYVLFYSVNPSTDTFTAITGTPDTPPPNIAFMVNFRR